MSRLLGMATLLGLIAAAAAGPGDLVLRRTVVPAPDRPHGEVRLLRRGDEVVVQTLLHTRVVRRAAGAIADKERASWPPGVPGHDDAERFVAALASVAAAAREAPDAADDDRRRGLCIELPPTGAVTVSVARIAAEPDGLRVVATVEPGVALDLSSVYVTRNRRLIVADAFGVDEATASRWLGEAGKVIARP